MSLYDNIDDARAKLLSTYVMYDGEAHICFEVQPSKTRSDRFIVGLREFNSTKYKHVKLTDPLLNYTRFNIGYVDYGTYAAWWCRAPIKQYQQGLKANQMNYSKSHPIKPVPVIGDIPGVKNMLENRYCDFAECYDDVNSGSTLSKPFHKDFALRLYGENTPGFVGLEYKANVIGFIKSDATVVLYDEYDYTREALNEAMHK